MPDPQLRAFAVALSFENGALHIAVVVERDQTVAAAVAVNVIVQSTGINAPLKAIAIQEIDPAAMRAWLSGGPGQVVNLRAVEPEPAPPPSAPFVLPEEPMRVIPEEPTPAA